MYNIESVLYLVATLLVGGFAIAPIITGYRLMNKITKHMKDNTENNYDFHYMAKLFRSITVRKNRAYMSMIFIYITFISSDVTVTVILLILEIIMVRLMMRDKKILKDTVNEIRLATIENRAN